MLFPYTAITTLNPPDGLNVGGQESAWEKYNAGHDHQMSAHEVHLVRVSTSSVSLPSGHMINTGRFFGC